MNDPNRPAQVLLVEDDLDDVTLMRESFKINRFKANLHHVENGLKCLDFLYKRNDYVDAPTPDLILLDLNMPVMDGRQVLENIEADDKLKHLRVVVLTTSTNEEDVLKMYKLRCSSYIVKPVDFHKFQKIVTKLTGYWFELVVLPPNGQ